MQRVLVISILAILSPVAGASGLGDWLTDGQANIDLRYRFEHVDQDNALIEAEAHTLRTRLGYKTADWNGLTALIEVDHVGTLGGSFNNTRNGKTTHSLIADPSGAAINQMLLRYDNARWAAIVGRQRINLDNQRFIGGVAWRQNEQTYDAAQLQLKPIDGMTLSYAWLNRVHTIFGPDNGPRANAFNQARLKGDSHLLHWNYVVAQGLALSAYHYRLDFDNAAVLPTAPLGTLNSATTGLRVSGTFEGLNYAFEHARQRDIAGNPWELNGRYVLAEVGYTFDNKLQAKLGYESLGGAEGSGNRAFQTPLATKHIFQGWADVFLTTPADGIQDRYANLSAPLAGGTLAVWYHDFDAQRDGGAFGTEFDLSYARAIPAIKGLSALMKLARYRSDDSQRTVDTDKYWLQIQYAY
ncbi:MAG: alginate export family protein [Xanthomonadales bacterium]|nr:alginate export family protein [Xanthomonadales bacterium]